MKYIHTSISVLNLEESKIFYESVFNLKFLSEGTRPGYKSKFLNLEDENHNVIELLSYENPLPSEEDLMNFQIIGIKHIAFAVDNLEQTIEVALSYGSKILRPIRDGVTVKRMAFISDPNGVPLELIEPKD